MNAISDNGSTPETDVAVQMVSVTREYAASRRRGKSVVTALDSVSLSVREAEVFGLVGPNGAGKTTAIRILTTLLAPSSGVAHVLGYNVAKDPAAIRPHINFVYGGDRGLYGRLTAREILTYFSDLYQIAPRVQRARIPELLELVGLSGRADERVETYSRGMRQRLHLARGLVNDPGVLFLDEPTMGLDPVGAAELRSLVRRLAVERRKTIFLTTHHMFEAETLCGRVAVLKRGRVVAIDSPAGLKRMAAPFWVVEFEAHGITPQEIEYLRSVPGVAHVSIEAFGLVQAVKVHVTDRDSTLDAIHSVAQDEGAGGPLSIREANLEDAYIQLVGEAS